MERAKHKFILGVVFVADNVAVGFRSLRSCIPRIPKWKILKGVGITLLCLAVLSVIGLFIPAPSAISSERSARTLGTPSLTLYISLVAVGAIFILWKLPRFQVSRSKALNDANEFNRVNEARRTLAQILAGIFLLAGLYSSIETFDLSREGQITDRFTKAVEQLGAVDAAGQPKIDVRLGGIYALERIARDSQRDHQVVMEILTAYVREHCAWEQGSTNVAAPELSARPQPVPLDIQAILKVLGRRDVRFDKDRVDLRNTDLAGANFNHADLSGGDLSSSNLTRANFYGADLGRIQLIGAALKNSDLQLADLSESELSAADLSTADLIKADLSASHLVASVLKNADLTDSDLSGADFTGADLTAVNFEGAYLTNVILSGAKMGMADIKGVDLSVVSGLTQHQIDVASGDSSTVLPARLKRPATW